MRILEVDTSAYENSTPPEFAGLLALLKAIGNESYDLIVCEPNVRRRLDAARFAAQP